MISLIPLTDAGHRRELAESGPGRFQESERGTGIVLSEILGLLAQVIQSKVTLDDSAVHPSSRNSGLRLRSAHATPSNHRPSSRSSGSRTLDVHATSGDDFHRRRRGEARHPGILPAQLLTIRRSIAENLYPVVNESGRHNLIDCGWGPCVVVSADRRPGRRRRELVPNDLVMESQHVVLRIITSAEPTGRQPVQGADHRRGRLHRLGPDADDPGGRSSSDHLRFA